MEKQEIISELYSIRAGLSLISENTDIIDQSENKIYSLKDQEYNSRKSYQADKDRLFYLRGEKKREENSKTPFLKERECYEGLITKEKAAIKEAPQKAKDESWLRLIPFYRKYDLIYTIIINLALLFVSGVAFMLITGILGTIIFGDDSWAAVLGNDGTPKLMYGSLIGGIAAYPVICFIVFLCKRKKITQQITDEMIMEHTAQINHWQVKLNNVNAEIDKHDKKIRELSEQEARLEANQQSYLSGVNTTISSNEVVRGLCETVIDHCVKENVRIRDFLANNYNNVITPSDWANIDLIVYYFNTGRADTIKEALQLVDEQRRNDAIVSAIHSAAREISGTIQRNFKALSGMLSSHFSRINMQIEDMSFRMDKLGNEMKNMSSVLGSQISKLTEVNRLQSAFMVKAAKSTAELVDDMNRSVTVNVAIRNV